MATALSRQEIRCLLLQPSLGVIISNSESSGPDRRSDRQTERLPFGIWIIGGPLVPSAGWERNDNHLKMTAMCAEQKRKTRQKSGRHTFGAVFIGWALPELGVIDICVHGNPEV